MRRAAHIVVLAALLAALCACSHRARLIPAEKLSRIYYDMFLADQWIKDNPDERKVADTTLVFDPIFRRYGYSFEDYDYTLQYYLDRPDDFDEILQRTEERLRKDGERLQQEADALTARDVELARYRRGFERKDFSSDSLRWTGESILWPERPEKPDLPETEEDTTTTELYELPGKIRLHSGRGGSSEPDSIRRIQLRRPVHAGGVEKVLLPDGPDHVEVQ